MQVLENLYNVLKECIEEASSSVLRANAHFYLAMLISSDSPNESAPGYAEACERASEHFLLAARLGLVIAMEQMSLRYYQGLGVERDLEAMKYWLEKASYHGSMVAKLELALLFTFPSDVQGFYYIDQRSKAGDPEALFLLGLCHVFGRVVQKDVSKGMILLKKATKLDSKLEKNLQELSLRFPDLRECSQ